DNQKCSHCPLKAKTTPNCPIAVNLADLFESLDGQKSFTQVEVKVTAPERTYVKQVELQEGLFSLVGLIMATSQCPYMEFLRPMARFHLPFSSPEETITRSVSIHLLWHYFNRTKGERFYLDLSELAKSYEEIQQVNVGFVKRMPSIPTREVSLNAVSIL